MTSLDAGAADLDDRTWSQRFERVLRGEGVRTVFQPIADLRRRVVVGYEALTRFDAPDGFAATPDRWFAAAHRLGIGGELEAVTIRRAFESRRSLPVNCFLTVNVDPDHLSEPAVRDALIEQGDLGGVVVELTEHRDWSWDELAPAVRMLRSSGALIAIDDAGAGHSGLQQILRLRPSILKLDRALVSGIDRDEAKVALVEMIGVLASRLDAWVLAEGIETVAEASRLVDLEVPLAQGYLFGKPVGEWSGLDESAVAELAEFAERTEDTLRKLLEPVASIERGERPPPGWFDGDDDWLVVVDEHRRPLGVVDGDATISGELVPALVANVASTAAEVAARLCASSHVLGAPVVVIDNAGRYLGIVSLRRLLGRLATG